MGRDGVVKLLLEWEEVKSNRPEGYYGQTPFSWGAENGHWRVVKLLLGQKDVNPNMPDHCGQTPLLWRGPRCGMVE